MQKVEDVKRPLKKGEFYIVPCIIKDNMITPVLLPGHSDKENGQKEIHYHPDTRFIDHAGKYFANREDYNFYVSRPRPQVGIDGILDYFVLPVFNEEMPDPTQVEFIKNSKLKHKCIHKGKCPHRGYDLSQVEPKDGVIKCPLHGLIFHKDTGKLLTRRYDDNQKPRSKK